MSVEDYPNHHGSLAGLSDTDHHPQYLTPARADLVYRRQDAALPTKTLRLGHTWHIPGDVKVASGDTDFILPFFVPVPAGQTVTIAGVWHRINSGTSASIQLARNGTVFWGAGAVTTTAGSAGSVDSPTFVNNDALSLIVQGVSGSPKNLSFTVYLDYTV